MLAAMIARVTKRTELGRSRALWTTTAETLGTLARQVLSSSPHAPRSKKEIRREVGCATVRRAPRKDVGGLDRRMTCGSPWRLAPEALWRGAYC